MELTLIFSLFALVVLTLIVAAIQGITRTPRPVPQPEESRAGRPDDGMRR